MTHTRLLLTAVLAAVFSLTLNATRTQTNSTPNNPHMSNHTLTPKQQALATIAAFAAKGDLKHLDAAFDAALDSALTVNEAREAMSHLYAYVGFPHSLNGLSTLQQVLARRQKEGRAVTTGKDATALPASYDALKQGTEVQTKLCGGKPYNYTFAPATDFYLKSHLFGDIFARDVLTHAERELVTVSALSAVQGVEPQLKAHVGGSRNMGVSDDELRALPALLTKQVGAEEGWRAQCAVATVLGDTLTEHQPLTGNIFPQGEPNTAYAKYFTGNSYLAPLLKEDLPLSNVTFEPRCRNNWHIHHKAVQILICVGGEGWYQEWGKPAQRLKPGDVVRIPAEVKHWHGATASSWFQHIATAVAQEGASNEWLEPVDDEQYNALPE